MIISRRSSVVSNRKYNEHIIGYRHLQCFLLFMGFCLIFAMRVNLSIAVVAMMDSKAANPNFPEYDWTEKIKSYILSSFSFGYIFLQIPAGGWARRFGGCFLTLLSVCGTSILSILTPLTINIGDWPLLCSLRFCQGILQGVLFPSIATIMSKWAPVEERSAMQTFTYAGCQLGIVVMLSASGELCSSRWGWPSTFYIPGVLGLIWSALWFVFGANTPRDCKHISASERAMIEESLGHDKKSSENSKTAHAVPWKHILTSKHVLVLLLNHCANDWFFWTLLTQIPSFIKNVLGKDINSNALISSLPYLSMFLLSLTLCPIASWLEKSKRLSATVSRKIFNTIGFWIPATTLVVLGYLRPDQCDLAIGLLTVSVAINTNIHFGYCVNHLDLAPNFAGTLLGIGNFGANIMGFIAPLFVGFIVTDAKDISQWRIIFLSIGCISFLGNLSFLIFGTAKSQWWDKEPHTSNEVEQLEELVRGTEKTTRTSEENSKGVEETQMKENAV